MWIEILLYHTQSKHHNVTPLAGVWIEITYNKVNYDIDWSLPLRECGLKFAYDKADIERVKVTPLAGVWIEI